MQLSKYSFGTGVDLDFKAVLIDQAKAAIDHGSKFTVSPGMNVRLVEWCL